MQPLYLLAAVDVRRAQEAGSSRATTIAKLVMPAIQFAKVPHNPGGGIGAVGWAMPRTEEYEPKFEAKGIDKDIFRGMGLPERWTFAGAYREQKPGGGAIVPARAVIEGAITGWEPDDSSPEEFQGCNHSFTQVTHYELTLGDDELFYWDWYERVFRRGGEDLFAEVRQGLGA